MPVDLDALTDLTPASDRDFASVLVPCLQLVAPVGMTEDAQDMWLEAASMALADVPADLLRRGAAEAMQKADHPAKVVPAIIAAVKDDLAWRRRMRTPPEALRDTGVALPAPGEHRCTTDEAEAICRQFGIGRFSKHAQADAA